MSNGTNATSDMEIEKKALTLMIIIMGTSAFVGNCAILACIPKIRRRCMNANLQWSLSLAASDAWAALLITTGLVWNSYLPMVAKVNTTHCLNLCLEVFRIGGIITSVWHLLALSLNHYLSIVDPFKHKLTMTNRRCKTISAVLWLTPLVALFITFGSLPGDGFRHNACLTDTYYLLRFRVPIFVVFYLPMIIMLAVYGKILRMLHVARKQIDTPVDVRSSPTSESRLVVRKMSQANCKVNKLKSRLKAVTTTLLIVGTFGLGYMPAVIFFVIYCNDCPLKAGDLNPVASIRLGALVNCLITLKLLVNPLIYGFRILEIRRALGSTMRHLRRVCFKNVESLNSTPTTNNARTKSRRVNSTFKEERVCENGKPASLVGNSSVEGRTRSKDSPKKNNSDLHSL